MMIFWFGCSGQRVLHGSSCLLAYENAPARIAARQLSWLESWCFLAYVVWIREEYNSILSTPTEADKIGQNCWHRYISETHISVCL